MNDIKLIVERVKCNVYSVHPTEVQDLANAYIELENRHRTLTNAIAIASWNIKDEVKEFYKEIVEYAKGQSPQSSQQPNKVADVTTLADASGEIKDECICGEINARHCPVHNEKELK